MVLKAEHLVKKYKKRKVVNDISVTVAQGEIVGLLGPNGAGKTTSFYMMVGLIKPNEGEIYLDDENITAFPMYKRSKKGIGYLAQDYGFGPALVYISAVALIGALSYILLVGDVKRVG